MYCKNCGNQILQTGKFCPKCGTPLFLEGDAAENAGDQNKNRCRTLPAPREAEQFTPAAPGVTAQRSNPNKGTLIGVAIASFMVVVFILAGIIIISKLKKTDVDFTGDSAVVDDLQDEEYDDGNSVDLKNPGTILEGVVPLKAGSYRVIDMGNQKKVEDNTDACTYHWAENELQIFVKSQQDVPIQTFTFNKKGKLTGGAYVSLPKDGEDNAGRLGTYAFTYQGNHLKEAKLELFKHTFTNASGEGEKISENDTLYYSGTATFNEQGLLTALDEKSTGETQEKHQTYSYNSDGTLRETNSSQKVKGMALPQTINTTYTYRYNENDLVSEISAKSTNTADSVTEGMLTVSYDGTSPTRMSYNGSDYAVYEYQNGIPYSVFRSVMTVEDFYYTVHFQAATPAQYRAYRDLFSCTGLPMLLGEYELIGGLL